MKIFYNKSNEPYFVSIDMDEEDAKDFLLALWQHANNYMAEYYDRNEIIKEYTDRGNCFRTRYSCGEVVIYTHGWHPKNDKEILYCKVIEFLNQRGVL